MCYDVEVTAVIRTRIEANAPREAMDKLNDALWRCQAEGQVYEIDIDTQAETATVASP